MAEVTRKFCFPTIFVCFFTNLLFQAPTSYAVLCLSGKTFEFNDHFDEIDLRMSRSVSFTVLVFRCVGRSLAVTLFTFV